MDEILKGAITRVGENEIKDKKIYKRYSYCCHCKVRVGESYKNPNGSKTIKFYDNLDSHIYYTDGSKTDCICKSCANKSCDL